MLLWKSQHEFLGSVASGWGLVSKQGDSKRVILIWYPGAGGKRFILHCGPRQQRAETSGGLRGSGKNPGRRARRESYLLCGDCCIRQDRRNLARSSISNGGRAAAGGAQWKKVGIGKS